MSAAPKTIFCDIDGTLWTHQGDLFSQGKGNNTLLPFATEAITEWERRGYTIILVTGRKESMRRVTEAELQRLGIVYDQLIMGLGGGDRIIVNDRKYGSSRNTCFAVNVARNKGIPMYQFDNNHVTISDNQPQSVEKPWGREQLVEYNDHYVVKKLLMREGECCSLQYHELKRETVTVISGKLRVYHGDDINNLQILELDVGQSMTIEPGTIHRMEGIMDCVYLECSTNELWDVVRLQDKYRREGQSEHDYVGIAKDLIGDPTYSSNVLQSSPT